MDKSEFLSEIATDLVEEYGRKSVSLLCRGVSRVAKMGPFDKLVESDQSDIRAACQSALA